MEKNLQHAYLGGGCFWGVEYYMRKLDGVVSVEPGYMGGPTAYPTYEQVCSGVGHVEVVDVIFDTNRVSYEKIIRLFMEIHDPTQLDGQGPDIGVQYRSVIFYCDDEQKAIAEKCIAILKGEGYHVVTSVEKAQKFWLAEDYHHDYYNRKGTQPYCHGYVKRFKD